VRFERLDAVDESIRRCLSDKKDISAAVAVTGSG